MHVAVSTFSEVFSWGRKDAELIWYHAKGDCTSDPSIEASSPSWMPQPLSVLGVRSCNSLLRQSCKLIPMTAVVTMSSVLGFCSTGTTMLLWEQWLWYPPYLRIACFEPKLYRENIIRTVKETICMPAFLSEGAGSSEPPEDSAEDWWSWGKSF